MSMVLLGVVGFKLSGKFHDGVTATDLVLTVTQILRKHGVVGKFFEFYGNFNVHVAEGIRIHYMFIKLTFICFYFYRKV